VELYLEKKINGFYTQKSTFLKQEVLKGNWFNSLVFVHLRALFCIFSRWSLFCCSDLNKSAFSLTLHQPTEISVPWLGFIPNMEILSLNREVFKSCVYGKYDGGIT